MSDVSIPATTENLTERERKQIERLLSDPTQLPMAFKTWLVSYLEASDLTLPLSSVQGLQERLDAINKRIDAL